MIEHFFICPSCLQQISMLLDISVPEQTYIEDCEVCCRPLQVNFTVEADEITSFHAELAQ